MLSSFTDSDEWLRIHSSRRLKHITTSGHCPGVTEREFIEGLRCYTREWTAMPDEALWLSDRSVAGFPKSAELWFLRSQIVGGPEDGDCAARMTLDCLQRCIALDPNHAEAHHHLGLYFDGIRDNPDEAARYYDKAAQLRAAVVA